MMFALSAWAVLLIVGSIGAGLLAKWLGIDLEEEDKKNAIR